jgi:hypothetical protein
MEQLPTPPQRPWVYQHSTLNRGSCPGDEAPPFHGGGPEQLRYTLEMAAAPVSGQEPSAFQPPTGSVRDASAKKTAAL